MTANTDASTIEILLADGTLQAVIQLRELADTTEDADTRKAACRALYLLSKKRATRKAAAHALYLLTQNEVSAPATEAEATTQPEPASSTGKDHMPWAWNTPDTKKVSITTTKPRKPFDCSLFKVIGFAVLIGCGLAFGIIGFLYRYQTYQNSAGEAKFRELLTQGTVAYNNQDYATAAGRFEQALATQPNETNQSILRTSLTYTYVQLARQAKSVGNTQQSVDDYNKAVAYTPDYGVAHEELSVLKESLQDTQGAQAEIEAVRNSRFALPPPERLQASTSESGSQFVNSADPNAILRSRSEQAKQLIQEGDQLLKNDDVSGAIRKWRDACDSAPGLPEYDQARSRINQYDSAGNGF